MSTHTMIEQHPDILALRVGYERAAESMTAQTTFGLTLLAGIYAAISPWVVGFDATPRLAANNLIVGFSIALLAAGFGWALERTHGMTWTLPVLGVWLIISPWVIVGAAPSVGMMWSNCLVGGVITALGLAAAYFGVRARNLESG